MPPPRDPNRPPLPQSTAFLLTALGTRSAEVFAWLVGEHGFTPPQAGMLRQLAVSPDLSQQELADRLGMLPSRVVAFVDELEEGGLVDRVRDEVDRRRNTLRLTDAGRAALVTIGRVARRHDEMITGVLDPDERIELARLLGRVADAQGLTPGVHPGYRALRTPPVAKPATKPATKPDTQPGTASRRPRRSRTEA